MAAFKAQAMMRKVKEELKLTVPGVSFIEGNDSSFFPILIATTGAGATRDACIVKIEMLPDLAQHKDALDLPQRLYSPHAITILRESVGGTEAPQNPDLREKVSAQCVQMGAKVSIYEKEAIRLATTIAAYNLSGATLISEVGTDSRKMNPLTNSQ